MRTILWQPLSRRTLRSVTAVCALLAGSALAAVASGAAQAASRSVPNRTPPAKLDPYPDEDANRRVLAVLTYLNP